MKPAPTIDKIYGWLLTLLPRGPAWQTNDIARRADTSKLHGFFRAIATVWADLEADLSAAPDEFFCETSVVNQDLWQQDYGLPDECDPTGASACVLATSGTGQDIPFYERIATALGYSTSMQWIKGGIIIDGVLHYEGVYSTLYVVIDSAASSVGFGIITLGTWELGSGMGLGTPDFLGLICVLDKMLPAHVELIFEVI